MERAKRSGVHCSVGIALCAQSELEKMKKSLYHSTICDFLCWHSSKCSFICKAHLMCVVQHMAYRPHWFTRRYRLLFIYMSLTSHSIFLCLRTSICTCEYVDSNIRSSRFTCAVCMRIMIPTPAPGLTVDVVGFMN